jgi:hypothetical protein
MRLVGYVTPLREMRNAHNILVGKAQRKRPFGRTRRRWRIIL